MCSGGIPVRSANRRRPLAVAACHCTRCRRQSGSVYSVNLLAPTAAVTIEGEVQVFEDTDTTSGNSGSATLNARGELCGLHFDGTLDSVAADWMFVPDSHRSIDVDIRYVAWVMDAVDGADHVLAEMGVTPSL